MSNYITLKTIKDKEIVAVFKDDRCVFASEDYVGYHVGNKYSLDKKVQPTVFKYEITGKDLLLGLTQVKVGFTHSQPEEKLLAALTPQKRGE